jgi:diacylglycerol kinase (ATP)
VVSVRLAGGTFVTPYGAHSAAQAAGTWLIGVVVVTDAQGPTAALGRGSAVAVGLGVAVRVGVALPHADTDTTARVVRTTLRMPPLSTVSWPFLLRGMRTVPHRAASCRGHPRSSQDQSWEAGQGMQSRMRDGDAAQAGGRHHTVVCPEIGSAPIAPAPIAIRSRPRTRPVDTIRPVSLGSATQPRTLVVVNPASAGGRTGRRWPALRDAMYDAGLDYDVLHTSAPGDATSAARRALRQGYERVVVAGGDGTLNEAVNGFFTEDGSPINSDAVLGLLPSGTGGDFRRTIGLPTDPAQLARILAAGHSRIIDTGRITYDDPATASRRFINIADCGVGGEVVAHVNRSRNKSGGVRGTAVFLGISLRALTTFGGRPVRLTLDGEVIEMEVQNVAVANGRCFGGGMRIAPHAELDDGVFDVVMLPAMGRLPTLRGLPSVYRGAHIKQPRIVVRRAREVRVEPLDDRPLLFDIEGEQIGTAPATLVCVPASLRFCVSAAGTR